MAVVKRFHTTNQGKLLKKSVSLVTLVHNGVQQS